MIINSARKILGKKTFWNQKLNWNYKVIGQVEQQYYTEVKKKLMNWKTELKKLPSMLHRFKGIENMSYQMQNEKVLPLVENKSEHVSFV